MVLRKDRDRGICGVARDGEALELRVTRGLHQQGAAEESGRLAGGVERRASFGEQCGNLGALGAFLQRGDVAEDRIGATRIAGSVHAARNIHAAALQRDGLVAQAELDIHVGQRVEHHHLALRRILERHAHARRADVEQLARRRLLRLERVGLLVCVGPEEIEHEALRGLRALRFLLRERGLRARLHRSRARDRRLPHREARARHDCDEHRGGGADREPVAQYEFAQPIPRAVRPREHRFAAHVTPEILGERIDRRVALGRRAS